MKKELAGMYPGIRAAAADDSNRFFKHPADGGFQNLLHIHYPWMLLPAAIAAGVVGYVEEISQWVMF